MRPPYPAPVVKDGSKRVAKGQRIPCHRRNLAGPFRQSLSQSGPAAAFSLFEGAAWHRLCRARLCPDRCQHSVGRGAQLPVGYLVDRVGSRRMLVLGLVTSALAFISFGLSPSYSRLLLAMALLGVANSVFHPLITRSSRPGSPPPALAVRFRSHLFRHSRHRDRAGDDARRRGEHGAQFLR